MVEIFHDLVDTVAELLPDFGRRLAVDSKAIRSYARNTSDKLRSDGKPDRRGEHDADIAQKTKFQEHPDGTVEELLYEWFGFKLHLAVDSKYQLPVSFEVTKGLNADSIELEPLMNDWYDQDGQIYCAYQKPGAPNADRPWDWRPMAFKGYETDRQSVKYVCPAK